MTFNVQVGNNDEFKGNLPRTETGTFCYTTRYSGDGGNTWYYPVAGPDGGSTCPGLFGVMTITTGSDTTAPAAPANLAVNGVTSASITLGWDAHPNTDGDLYAFRVYRGPVGGPFAQIAQIANTGATSYVDTSVTAGATYEYYVTAMSAASNTVQATAENLIVDVTFRVTVPSFTPDDFPVYIVGPFNGWNPSDPAYALTETSPNVWEITLQILDGTNFQHKYARNGWDRVEKLADGFGETEHFALIDYGTTGEQLVEDTVANWRDR
ncbi:MAG: alpha-amylase, partial [Anaerolineae bacterium]